MKMKRTKIPSYLDDRKFTAGTFFEFLKGNKAAALTTLAAVIMIYGVKLANICFGIDTELHMAVKRYVNWIAIGRIGLVGLQKLWTNFVWGKEVFNPYLSVLMGCAFLYFGTMLWCALAEFFAAGKINRRLYVPFALIIASSQVWTEQIYFALQAAECMFVFFVSPVAVYLLFKGTLDCDARTAAFGIALSVLCTSVYQGVLMLICCGIFAMFLLFKENSACEKREYSALCLSLLGEMAAITAVYLAANKILSLALGERIKGSSYLFDMIEKGRSPLEFAKNFGVYVYQITLANIPGMQDALAPIMAKYATSGWKAVEFINGQVSPANVLLVPGALVYFAAVARNKSRSPLFVMSSVCVILCVFALHIIGGVPLRSDYALPFASAFVFLYDLKYLLEKGGGVLYKAGFALVVIAGVRAVFVNGALNYSDAMRYQSDARLSADIARMIYDANPNGDAPVFLYGRHEPQFEGNFLQGEVCARSPFEYNANTPENILDATARGLAFMRTQGFNFTPVTEDDAPLVSKARAAAEKMPDYPNPASVANLGDVVVVRLSKTTYDENAPKR